ncbi:MAG TPA: adenylate/guanylate cyclase domain-containing protein [Gemmatimonadota bacterium]|nr:adenylate/guanylate cyclase domain-containing protein [Gemmatimonadota bacterium]
MTTSDRSLATVLFTDIVGSTERATELGDREWRKLLEEHHTRVRRELRRFGGRELNTAGDGFLALFQGPARAIACADAIRSAVRDVGLEVRCSVHMGEVEGKGKTVGGIGVHIAARVMAEAGPGEVLVSRSVRDSVEGAGFEFEDRGARLLKGVTGERRLYAVTGVPADLGEAQSTRATIRDLLRRPLVMGVAAGVLLLLAGLYATRRDAVPELTPEEALAANAAPGIAVLPFTVNDPDLATWREGMVDLLSINLDGLPGLRPIASRTVLARWREEVPDVADLGTSLEVARRTGARFAIVGSAVAIGDEVRFGADIYDARSGTLIGSAQAQGSPDSMLALVDRLSLDVVRALPQGEEGVLPRVDLASVTTTSLPALKSYLEGEALFRRGEFPAATAAYERAVVADSTFALALSRLGQACGWGIPGPDCNEYIARAVAHINRLPPRAAVLVRANYALFHGSLEGIEPLRRAIEKYPDDSEAWFLLGDTYEHGWQAALVDREEAERVIARAVELDPTFAPYYLHLIEHAINNADSARAISLLETYGRLAPGSEDNTRFRLGFDLNFGDPASRARARAAVDTASAGMLFGLAMQTLRHPSNLPLQGEVYRMLRTPDAAPWFVEVQFQNPLRRGRFVEAEALLHDPVVSADFKKASIYRLYRMGMNLPPDQLEREFELSPADTTPDGALNHLLAGAYAVDRGRWAGHGAVLDRARGEAGRRRAAGDSVAAHMFDGAARALEGYGLWKRGRATEALPRLESVQRDMRGGAGGAYALNEEVRWWLGHILKELGRPRDALVYFRTFDDPFGEYESAKIFEELGEFDEARQSYEYALLSWRDADPELQPRIAAAREALARLPKLLRRESS